jgi:hypothetical protein
MDTPLTTWKLLGELLLVRAPPPNFPAVDANVKLLPLDHLLVTCAVAV